MKTTSNFLIKHIKNMDEGREMIWMEEYYKEEKEYMFTLCFFEVIFNSIWSPF